MLILSSAWTVVHFQKSVVREPSRTLAENRRSHGAKIVREWNGTCERFTIENADSGARVSQRHLPLRYIISPITTKEHWEAFHFWRGNTVSMSTRDSDVARGRSKGNFKNARLKGARSNPNRGSCTYYRLSLPLSWYYFVLYQFLHRLRTASLIHLREGCAKKNSLQRSKLGCVHQVVSFCSFSPNPTRSIVGVCVAVWVAVLGLL